MINKNLWISMPALMVAMALSSCGKNYRQATYSVLQDSKYDAVYLNESIEDFRAFGFEFGDSCDVSFSNGLTFEDIPFFNGYYVRTGQPLIVGYPGYDYVAVTRNNKGLWTESGLTNDDTATITLREAGKYKAQQEAMSQSYSNDRKDYKNDAQFANFRALSGGNLKANFLYRGATPIDNRKNRASTVDGFLEENEINFVLNLAATEEEFRGYREATDFASPYVANLYDEGNIALLSMSSAYSTDLYKQKLASGLNKMIESDGPIYIHCLEGKDRTGFVCLVLEALAGASYDEMLADYMKTYENYYGITKEGTPEKFKAVESVYFLDFTSYLHGTEDTKALSEADYRQDAMDYLLSAGMSAENIAALTLMITE